MYDDWARRVKMMLKIGDQYPKFAVTGVVSSNLADAFTQVDSSSYQGKWKVAFFWPMDFTFVCPTEIAEFGRLNSEFSARDAQVLGVSTDSEFVQLAERRRNAASGINITRAKTSSPAILLISGLRR
jgi:peroxiredoxin (alkyl hydroperoxide reductase subunit C)